MVASPITDVVGENQAIFRSHNYSLENKDAHWLFDQGRSGGGLLSPFT